MKQIEKITALTCAAETEVAGSKRGESMKRIV